MNSKDLDVRELKMQKEISKFKEGSDISQIFILKSFFKIDFNHKNKKVKNTNRTKFILQNKIFVKKLRQFHYYSQSSSSEDDSQQINLKPPPKQSPRPDQNQETQTIQKTFSKEIEPFQNQKSNLNQNQIRSVRALDFDQLQNKNDISIEQENIQLIPTQLNKKTSKDQSLKGLSFKFRQYLNIPTVKQKTQSRQLDDDNNCKNENTLSHANSNQFTISAPSSELSIQSNKAMAKKREKRQRRMSSLKVMRDMEEKYHMEDLEQQRDKVKKEARRYIIRFSSQWKLLWDMIVIACAIFNSFMIPFCVAFRPPFSLTRLYDLSNDSVNYMFMLDILISFRTSRLNVQTGEEIFDPKDIAIHYVSSINFWLDLISAPPYDKFGEEDFLQFFNMIKTIRILRISTIIEQLTVNQNAKTMMKLFNVIFLQVMTLHIQGCIYFYLCTMTKTWTPPCDWTMTNVNDFYDSRDYQYLYWTCMYYSVLIYSVNDIGATSVVERGFVGYMGIFFAIINANIFGIISLLVQDLNKKTYAFHQEIQDVVSGMISLKIPSQNQDVFKNYVRLTQNLRSYPEELNNLLKSISSVLRLRVQMHVLKPCLFKNSQLGHILKIDYDQQVVEKFISHMQLELACPEQIILQEGDTTLKNDRMYIITQGVFAVKQKSRSGEKQKIIRYLYQNQYFGEIAMIYMSRRSASVYSEYYSTLASIKYNDFNDTMQKYRKLLNGLKQNIAKYQDETQKFLHKAFSRIDYFRELSEDDQNSLVYNFKSQNFERGKIIFQPGDIPDNMYIVSSGVLEVQCEFSRGGVIPIENLRNGAVFCHNLFLFKKPVRLPIRCITEVQVMTLSLRKVEFLINHNQFSSLNKVVRKVQNEFTTYGFERIYLDLLPGFNINQEKDNDRYERSCLYNKILKNSCIYVLNKYRDENKRPQINDILRDMIEKKKAEIKLQKQQMADLINSQKRKNGQKASTDVAMPPIEVKSVRAFLKKMQYQISYQGQQIQSLKKKIMYSLTDGAAMTTLAKRLKFSQNRKLHRTIQSLEDEILNQYDSADSSPSNKKTRPKDSTKNLVYIQDQETDIPRQQTFSQKFSKNSKEEQTLNNLYTKQSSRNHHQQNNWDTFHSHHDADESFDDNQPIDLNRLETMEDKQNNKSSQRQLLSNPANDAKQKKSLFNKEIKFQNSPSSQESHHTNQTANFSIQSSQNNASQIHQSQIPAGQAQSILENYQQHQNVQDSWGINKEGSNQQRDKIDLKRMREKIEEKFEKEIRHQIEAIGIKIIDDDPRLYHDIIDWHQSQNLPSQGPIQTQSSNEIRKQQKYVSSSPLQYKQDFMHSNSNQIQNQALNLSKSPQLNLIKQKTLIEGQYLQPPNNKSNLNSFDYKDFQQKRNSQFQNGNKGQFQDDESRDQQNQPQKIQNDTNRRNLAEEDNFRKFDSYQQEHKQKQKSPEQVNPREEKLVFKDIKKFIEEQEEKKRLNPDSGNKDPNRPKKKKIIYSQSGSTKNKLLWQNDDINY